MIEVEINKISRKYEDFRLKDPYREKELLNSLVENGVRNPLLCAGDNSSYILFDGFKRLRCCLKLNCFRVPVTLLGKDETSSILYLIRQSNERTLNILEQARFVDELKKKFSLSVNEIALKLERSKSWVSVRLGILDEMSDTVRKEVFSGRFPLRCYMYNLRQFTRVNKIDKKQIDDFVKAVSGKSLSQRSIEKLAYGYFRGSYEMKKQIREGNINWTLKKLGGEAEGSHIQNPDLSDAESHIIRDMELLQKYMTKVHRALSNKKEGSKSFMETARILLDGILSRITIFEKEVQLFDTGKYS